MREIRTLRVMWRELETGLWSHLPVTAPVPDPTCVQERLACSVGVSPTGVEVRNPLAWVVSVEVEETKRRKPTDKAIFGMVSESPGRNASEPIGGLETEKLRRPSPLGWGEGSMA